MAVVETGNQRWRVAVERGLESVARPNQLLPILLWPCLLLGTLLVASAYSYAATHSSGKAHFHLFWAGILVFTAPAFLRLCAANLPRGERYAILAATGLFYFLPKFLRDPDKPLFIDELAAHWRQAEVIHSTGRPFVPNPTIGIVEYFPGLHTLTAALRDLSGLSTFQIGLVLVALLHAIVLVGVFVIAERLTRSPRAGGLAAFLYALNPSFMFFDAQYSYESLAIVFFVWVVAAVVVAQAEPDRTLRIAWLSIGLVLAAACIVTHHLASYALVAVVVGIQLATTARRRRRIESRANALLIGAFAFLVSAGAAAWLLYIGSKTEDYLSPHLLGGVREIFHLIGREQESRVLFEQSRAPGYERLFAYLSPVIAAVGAAIGLWLLRRRRHPVAAGPALVLFGLLYFPSLPFILTQAGQEGARRSWGYTYLGLSLLAAPALLWALERVSRTRARQKAALCAATAAVSIVLIGNVAMDLNVEYRFPGPFVYGSDTRSLTAEVLGTTDWFRGTQGTHENVITDRYTGMALASFGLNWTAPPFEGFPTWELFFKIRPPRDDLLRALERARYRYMVVDRRMARHLPRVGVYFVPDEPTAYRRKTPIPAAGIGKYEQLPWAIKIYATDNLAIYRLDFAALGIETALAGRAR